MGSAASVGTFTRDDLVAHHRHFYAPNNMIMAVATNLDPDTIKAWIAETFGAMPSDDSPYTEIPVPAKPDGVQEVHQQMDKEQIYIYMGMILPGLKSPDAPAMNMAPRSFPRAWL